jgi:hypothetical protein
LFDRTDIPSVAAAKAIINSWIAYKGGVPNSLWSRTPTTIQPGDAGDQLPQTSLTDFRLELLSVRCDFPCQLKCIGKHPKDGWGATLCLALAEISLNLEEVDLFKLPA